MRMLDERELKIMCQTIKKDFPDRDDDFYKMFLSTEVLRLMIDNEWVNQSIFSQHGQIEKKNRDAFDYFNSGLVGFEWQERVSRFAERIYNLRRVPNIEIIIQDIIDGNLVSRFAEIEVGSHLHGRGIKFEFVIPSGQKGKDYDIQIVEPLKINCEVKHKIESTNLSENTLTNTIRASNDQLPTDIPAIIFIKIPERWAFEPDLIKTIKNTFKPFFQRNKDHIIGIVLRWEQRDSYNEGMFYWIFRLFFNEKYQTNHEIEFFLNQLEGKRTIGTSFSDIVSKYFH
jgi:hypothetical protein